MKEPSAIASALDIHSERRVDGIVEIVGTFGIPEMFFQLVKPDGPAHPIGVVICPSYFEMPQMQVIEMSLARALAAAGFGAIYVQPPGVGDSEGDPSASTFEHRVGAAMAASEELRRRLPEVTDVCLFGARYGGLVAAVAVTSTEDGLLALWDPGLEPDVYWRQVRRFARVASVVGRRRAVGDPEKDLERDGSVIVLGMLVTRAQLDDLLASGSRLAAIEDRRCLIVSSTDGSAQASAKLLGGPADSITTIGLGKRDLFHLGLRRAGIAIPPTVDWLSRTVRESSA
jgi:alpha/beta superfamily hydrolase